MMTSTTKHETERPGGAPAAISMRGVSKVFRLPRSGAGAAADPRRERAGRHDLLHALRDVSFDLPKGTALGIVGANGSGKSTLLKVLAGVTPPDAGSFRTDGQVSALLEVGAGFHPELTGIENIQLNGAVLGLGRRQMAGLLHEIIEFAGLERYMDMPVKHYSSGMTVRLGFAIASQLKPEILLLDETFAVGDAQFQAKALARIRRMKESGVTLVLVSHTPELILELADRVIWMDHGRIAMDGGPSETLAAYRRACGAHLMGCDHLAPARHAGGNQAAARVTRAVIRRADAAGDGAESGPVVLESSDQAVIDLEIERMGGVGEERLMIEALFVRDDRRPVAKSRVMLPDGTAGAFPLCMRIDPIRLAKGDYEVQLAVRRKGADEPEGPPVVAAPGLRIVTPLPYGDRLIADLEASWATG